MSWLPIYANKADCAEILAYLNQSEEIAFIVANGVGRWIAVSTIEALMPGRYCLWHVPSGPLPLFRGAGETPGEIVNPFGGWLEAKSGADSSTPYFGAGHPGIIWLNIRGESVERLSGVLTVGLSSFEWIGNHYKAIGSSAKPESEKFWKSLGRWVKKHATKVPRCGPQQSTPPEIWAFHGAIDEFENGAKGGNV